MKQIFNDSFSYDSEHRNHEKYYVLFKCIPCKKINLRICEFSKYKSWTDYEFNWRNWSYPSLEITEIDIFNWYIEGSIIDDFKEAIKCYEIEAYKACVTMCRRSLQSAVVEKWANPDDLLRKQINNLPIAQEIKDRAHEIRLFGNRGAHPNSDLLEEVTEAEAKETIDFLKQFFNYLYIMPKKVANSKIKRDIQSVQEIDLQEA